MSVTKEQIESFHRFAERKIENGEDDFTMESLLDMWQLENPSAGQFENDVLAVKAAVRDLQNGERGVSFESHIRELRDKLDIPADE